MIATPMIVHYMGGAVLARDMLGWAMTLLALNALPPDPQTVGDRWREMWHDASTRHLHSSIPGSRIHSEMTTGAMAPCAKTMGRSIAPVLVRRRLGRRLYQHGSAVYSTASKHHAAG